MQVDLTPNGSLKIGDTILNNGGLTITGGPSVTKTGINAGNLNITNVKAGVNDTDAVNVKQLKDARTVVTSNDNSVTINKTENGNQVTYDLHVAPGAAQSVWNVKSTGNTTADSETAAKTISDGKTVEMAAGKNLTVKQTSNNDGLNFTGNNTDTVNKQKLNSLVKVQGEGVDKNTSATFKSAAGNINVKADGTDTLEVQLNKDLKNINTIKNGGNATFTIGGDNFAFNGGNVSIGGNNITNLKSGIVNNNDTDNTNAANIGDVKNISKANDLHIAPTTSNRTGETTTSYAYDTEVGKDGKDGIDGKIGVNGKDGSSVVINGKDGSIGLNGKDGKDGLTIRGEKGQDGVDGKNGTNGITRIVYEDHNNDKHEVATLDDGMKYAGDDAQGTDKSKVIAKKLNETMDVVGGADKSKLTDNNIGVNNVDGKLKVQLSKEVNLTPSGSLTIGDTVVNNNGLTISGGPSIIKTGINAGNLNITNVKAGVNDTDAVNVKQLKDARTVVTSNDNSVTVNKTENGNQITYDLHVAPGAAQSVWNVKSTGNTTADSETAPKTISDGKTVEMAAGKNLTVKQTSNNDAK